MEIAPLCACGCGQPVTRRLYESRKIKPWNKYLPKHSNRCQPRGERSHRWKGGEVRHKGYVFVSTPGHPRATNGGGQYVARAVLVAEQKLGRPLRPKEVVHHLNRQRDDDRPENIEVFESQGAHLAEHNRLRQAGKAARSPNNITTPAPF